MVWLSGITALLLMLINPGFMDVLWTDPVGLRMVGVVVTSMLFGMLWMRHIVRIRV